MSIASAVRGGGAGRVLRDEIRATVALSIPIALTQIAQMSLNTTDVVMTGRLGPEALAAGQLGHSLFFPMYITVIGVLFATAAMFAQEIGARRYKGVRRTARQGFWVIVSLTGPAWLYFWHAEWILVHALGQDPALAVRAGEYADGAMWGFPFMAGFSLLRNFIAAHSRPRAALYILAVGIVINAVADWVLMFGGFGLPRLELYGLGLATSIVQTAMFLGLLAVVLRDRRWRRYRILVRFWRPDWPRYREVWAIGLPIGLTKLAESGLFAASGFLVGLIGAEALAGHAVAIQYTAISFMVPFGIAQAATVRVGLAVGRGDLEAARRAGRVAMVVGVLVVLPMALLFVTAGGPLARLFLDGDDAAGAVAIAHATAFLAMAGLFQIADGGQAVTAGALRGFKDTRVPMVIAVVGYWAFGIGGAAVLAFPLGFGGVGVWGGLALGLAVVWAALVLRFRRVTRRIA
ncbi:MATE family efflux transporter [Thalassobaculum fulvum]|uniref:Multidrug-efflux transporter n=1 Tax=Thalassobaculum fulvum TaxID=1633335 RepID=A0A918XU43_9PROT|nr:MATE family efflux transporter [Thalassobaculum fulvum]GHD55214.1 MATE family efflux transporter [Thalassobaculum fulvum]